MKVYNYSDEGFYTGCEDAFPSPAEPGKFLIPRNATTIQPPSLASNERAFWNGNSWSVQKIVLKPGPLTWEQIKIQRNNLLSQTDWVGLKDVTVSNEQEWLNYRQALRDIPQTFQTPESVVWPIKPL